MGSVFQDRCLKPLGHPSALTTSNTYALPPAEQTSTLPPNCHRPPPTQLARMRVIGAGARPFPRPGHLRTWVPKKKTPLRRGASPRFGVCQDSPGDSGGVRGRPARLAQSDHTSPIVRMWWPSHFGAIRN